MPQPNIYVLTMRNFDVVNACVPNTENAIRLIGLKKQQKILFGLEHWKKLAQEILKHNDVLIQTKTEGEKTMKHIDETSDKISQESTDLRDKLIRHINDLVETNLDDLAQKVKETFRTTDLNKCQWYRLYSTILPRQFAKFQEYIRKLCISFLIGKIFRIYICCMYKLYIEIRSWRK